MNLRGILLLGFHVASADLDHIKFIRADAAIENFIAPLFGIEVPPPVFFDERYWKGPIISAYGKNSSLPVCRIPCDHAFFAGLCGKSLRVALVADRICGIHQILSIRAEDLYQGSDIIS